MYRMIAPCLALLGATTAFAGDSSDQSRLQSSFLNLRSKCSDFVANPQMKPVAVKLHCSQQEFIWKSSDPARASLKNFRQVGAQLDLKTFSSQQEFVPSQVQDTMFGCPTFVKVQREIPSIEVELSCSDLLGITDLHSFCENEIMRRLNQDPSLMEEKVTEETMKFCPNS